MEYCRQKDIQSKIGSIIQDAKTYIIIVSPYINLDSTYTALLEMSISKKIPVTFFYRKDNINDKNENFKDIERFEKLSEVTFHACPGLHAKIYMNEVDFLITSRNLYMKKGEESLDVGLFSNINENRDIYFKIKEDLKLFAHTSLKINHTQKKESNTKSSVFDFGLKKTKSKKQRDNSFCIRCGAHIPFNPDMPYCSSCFSSWNRYGDLLYTENHCHKCGSSDEDISMAKPLCFSCWKDWENSKRVPL
ncbi:MAG: hypothetical protein ACPKOI_04650 [Pleomorphochaeta sp.]